MKPSRQTIITTAIIAVSAILGLHIGNPKFIPNLLSELSSPTTNTAPSTSVTNRQPTPEPTPFQPNFNTRYFDPLVKLAYNRSVLPGTSRVTAEDQAGIDFPTELINLTDKQLKPFACPEIYRRDTRTGFYQLTNQTSASTPEDISLLFDSINQQLDQPFTSLLKCITPDQDGYVIYQTPANRKITDTANTIVSQQENTGIGYFNSSNQFTQITTFDNPGIDFFSCFIPYAITDDTMYIRCGGGSLLDNQIIIYKLNLQDGTQNQLLNCNLKSTDNGQTRDISCQ